MLRVVPRHQVLKQTMSSLMSSLITTEERYVSKTILFEEKTLYQNFPQHTSNRVVTAEPISITYNLLGLTIVYANVL